MDEQKIHSAYAVPKRNLPSGTVVAPPSLPPRALDNRGERVVAPITFAEVEVEAAAPQREGLVPLAQNIVQRPPDPIRDRFYAMRRFAYGSPFDRNNGALFYKQAKFMEFFMDDYKGYAPFSMYFPQYQRMSYEQLRTYFTWRTKLRAGEMTPTSLSYVFLYIYELLSGIGAKNPSDGLAKLMRLWDSYGRQEAALNQYLPAWLYDYHIYYILPHNFADFVEAHKLRAYYPDLFLFETENDKELALWNGLSNYDITKSKFYEAGNAELLEACLGAVLAEIQAFCERGQMRMEDLFCPGVRSRFPWFPFRRALFWPRHAQTDRTVAMPGGAHYSCISGRWFADMLIRETGRRECVGYLLKKMEVCLRAAEKYKFKLSANPGNLVFQFQKRGLSFTEFDACIERAVAQFERERKRTVVAVNPENLARIRNEAQGTQEKLIVEESPPLPALAAEVAEIQLADTAETDAWAAFKQALDATERQALAVILHNPSDYLAFAGKQGILPEILPDAINEKAADYIGDSILDFGAELVVYEEYRNQLLQLGL